VVVEVRNRPRAAVHEFDELDGEIERDESHFGFIPRSGGDNVKK
jgi:hypothetical protein